MTTPHPHSPNAIDILDRITDGIVAFDTEMNYTYVNRRGGEMLGRKPEDLIGKNYWKEFPEAKGTPFANAYVKALETQEPIIFEDYYQPWDRWFENRIYPSQEGLTIHFTEVTERKKAEEELRKAKELYQDLVETSRDPIWQCDAEGRYTFLNRAWEETHGYTIEEMLGKKFSDFQPPEYAERDMREFSRLMEGATVRDFETVHRRKDGQKIHLVFNAKFYFDREGKISGTLGTAYDITERKRAEEKLHTSQRNLQSLIENTDGYIFAADRNYQVIAGNSAFLNEAARQLGHPVQIGDTIIDDSTGQSEIHRQRKERYDRALRGEKFTFELELRSDTGLQWRQYWFSPMFSEDCDIVGFTAYARDITERKRVEEERASLALRNQALVQALGEIVYDWRPLEDSLIWDGDFTRILGYTSSEMGFNTESWTSRVHPEDVQHALEEVEMASQQRRLYALEYRFKRKDGTYIWMHDRGVTYVDERGTLIRIIGVFSDITERKQAEEKLQQSEVKYRRLFETMTDAFVQVDMAGHILECNPAYREMLGYTEDELRQLTYTDITPQKWHEIEERIVQEEILLHDFSGIYEKEYRHKDGTIFPVELRVSLIRDDNRQPVTMSAIVRDVTERKRAEEALRESEERFRIALVSSPIVVFHQDLDLRYTWIHNPHPGFNPEAVLGKTDEQLLPPEDAARLTEVKQSVLDTGKGTRAEVRTTIGGTPSYYDLTVEPLFDARGNLNGITCASLDITERKQAEEALRESERRLKKAEHLANLGHWELDLVTNDLHWSDQVYRMFGLEPQEFGATYEAFLERVHPDDRDFVDKAYNDSVENQTDYNIEHRIMLKDGTLKFVNEICVTIYDDTGKPLRSLGAVLDITERKQAQEALQASEERFRAIASNTPDHILVQDRQLRYTFVVNPQLGLREEDMIGKTDYDFLSREEADKLARMKTKVMETGNLLPFETPLVSLAGNTEYFEGNYVPKYNPHGEVDGLIGYFRNVTERKRAEEKLQQSESKYRRLFETMTDAFVQSDMAGHILECNPAYREMLGYTEDELRQLTYTDITPQKWHEIEERIVQEEILLHDFSGVYEKEYRRKDGTIFPVELRVSLIRDDNRQPVAMSAIVRDVTERKRAEEAIVESEKKFKDVVENAREIIYTTDLKGHFTYVNPAGLRKIEYTLDEMQQLSYLDLALPEHRTRLKRLYFRQYLDKTPKTYVEFPVRTKSGAVLWLGQNAALLIDNGTVVGFQLIVRDVTERKQAEEKIRRSREQLRALTGHLQTAIEEERARIAREIHDDIGQIFTAIKMDLSLLLRTIEGVKEKKIKAAVLEEINALIGLLDQGVQSIRKIVRDLWPEALETMGLLAGIEWQAKEFEKRTKVRVSLSLPKAEPSLDKQQTVALFRIVQEALTNVARHAEATRVKIEITQVRRTSTAESDLKLRRTVPLETRVVISDNGKGITDDAFAKPHSFGLLAMRERVTALGGELEIKGKRGKGTVVEVVLGGRA